MTHATDISTAGTTPAVEMLRISKRFPGVVANDDVDFVAMRGEVHALLGENGAGKSTLTNILTGMYRPESGEVRLFGEPVSFHTPRQAIDAGVGMVHQHFHLVAPFTVAENVVLGEHGDDRSRSVAAREIEPKVRELSERYGLAVDPGARIWQLSVGERQRVEILKMLYRDARILVLDEPTAVLTPQESTLLFATLRRMADEGRTVIFISHKLDEVMAASDQVTVLRDGRNAGTVATASTDARGLARMMVGREVVFSRRPTRTVEAAAPVALALAGVGALGDDGRTALHDIDLEVRAGEILGIAGVAGNGQRELAEVAGGRRAVSAGTVRVGTTTLGRGRPRDAAKAGVAFHVLDRPNPLGGVHVEGGVQRRVSQRAEAGAELRRRARSGERVHGRQRRHAGGGEGGA